MAGEKGITGKIAEPLRAFEVPIAWLRTDPRNPRVHPPEQIAELARSLSEFGQVKPILYVESTSVVIAGNGILEAARTLEWPTIAAIPVTDDPLIARALSIADNRLSEIGAWDRANLAEIVSELRADAPELIFGFDEAALADLLALLDDPEAGTSGDPPSEPGVKVFSVYVAVEEAEDFAERLRSIGERLGTKTVSDTLRRLVEEG